MIVNCSYFSNDIEALHISHANLYTSYNALAIRVPPIFRRIGILKNIFINPEVLNCTDDVLILFDGGVRDKTVLSLVADQCKAKRIIFWYWNPVANAIHPAYVPERFEKWSYSPLDCQRHNLLYNTPFYFNSYVIDNAVVPSIDVFFIGKDKGRLSSIKYYQKMFERHGLSTMFHIVATRPKLQRFGYDKNIPYTESLKLLQQSKCIFDFYTDPTAGLSLRAMEHIFMRRKLITNNLTISQYDFYNPENIFILGKDDETMLSKFVTSPYAAGDAKFCEEYSFQRWIERFSEA